MSATDEWYGENAPTIPGLEADPTTADLKRAGRNAAAGLAALPAVPVELGLLGTQLATTVARRYNGVAPDDEGYLDTFAKAALPADYKEQVEKHITSKGEELIAQGARGEALNTQLEAYTKSPEFKEWTNNQKSFVRRNTEAFVEGGQKLVGAPTGEDRTLGDDIMGLAAQVATPSIYAKAALLASKGGEAPNLLSKVLNTAHHMGAQAADPLTKGGLINAGIAEGMLVGADALTGGRPDHIPNDHTVDPSPLPETKTPDAPQQAPAILQQLQAATGGNWPAVLAMGGAAIAAVRAPEAMTAAATAAATNVVKRGALNLAEEAARSAGRSGIHLGDMVKQTPEPGPLSSLGQKVRTAGDELYPLTYALKQAGEDQRTINITESILTNEYRSNINEDVSIFKASGQIKGLDVTAPAPDLMYQYKEALQVSGKLESFNLYKTALAATEAHEANIEVAQQNYNKRLLEHQTKPSAATSRELNLAQERLTKLMTDDESVRHIGPKYSQEDWKELIRQGEADPDFKKIQEEFKRGYGLQQDASVAAEVLSPEQAFLNKSRYENFANLYADPNKGAKGLLNRAGKIIERNVLTTKENPTGDPGGDGINRFSKGRSYKVELGAEGGQQPLENLMDHFDAYNLSWEKVIRANGHARFTRGAVDAIRSAEGKTEQLISEGKRSAKGYRPALQLKSWPGDVAGGATDLTHEQIAGIRGSVMSRTAGKVDPFENLIPVNRGGKVQFYSTDVLGLKDALLQNPHVTFPVLREINRWFRLGTTGALRPVFATKNFLMDTWMIAAMRPQDSVNGFDHLFFQALKHTGISTDAMKVAVGAGRVADNLTFQMVPFALNLSRAVANYVNDNKLMLAKAMTNDLAVYDKGVFAQLAKTPMGKKAIVDFSASVIDGYHSGIQSALTEGHVASFEAMKASRAVKMDFDRFLTGNPRIVADAITNAAHVPLMQYKSMLSSIHSAAKVGYAMRNAEYLRWKHGVDDIKQIPKAELDKVLADARTLTGDFSRGAGHWSLQAFNSISPYNNIMLRSIQQVWQRMRQDNGATAAFLITGVAMPQAFSDWWMSNMAGKDGFNYYWHERPVWQRVSNYMLPRPQLLWKLLTTGQKPPFNRDDYYELAMAQEFRPIAQAVTQAVRAAGLGLHNAGITDILGMAQNDKQSGLTMANTAQVMGEAMGSAFGLNMPGLFTGAMAAGGVKVDLANTFKSHSIIEELPQSKKPGMENMNIGSDIPRGLANFMSGTLGALGNTMMQSLDTGVQTYKKSNDSIFGALMDATFKASREGVERTARDINVSMPYSSDIMPNAPLLGRGMDKVYRNTPTDEYVNDARKVVGMFSGQSASIKLPLQGSDPQTQVVNQIGMLVRAMGNSGEIRSLGKKYSEMTKRINQNESDRGADFFARTQNRNQLLLDMRNIVNDQFTFYDRIQTQIRQSPLGAQFKQMTGEDFSYKGFDKMLRPAIKQQLNQPVQRRYT